MECAGQQEPSTSGRAPERSPQAQKAAELLHRRFRVKVKDGRLLIGEFICLDRQGNIVLANCHESFVVGGEVHEKMMGQIIVPAAHRVSCEVEAMPGDYEALAALCRV